VSVCLHVPGANIVHFVAGVCPHCQAAEGERCRTPRGLALDSKCHRPRWRAATREQTDAYHAEQREHDRRVSSERSKLREEFAARRDAAAARATRRTDAPVTTEICESMEEMVRCAVWLLKKCGTEEAAQEALARAVVVRRVAQGGQVPSAT